MSDKKDIKSKTKRTHFKKNDITDWITEAETDRSLSLEPSHGYILRSCIKKLYNKRKFIKTI